jgi:hypothetical protein
MCTSSSISWEKSIHCFPSNFSISFKKINNLKGLEHIVWHICFFLQSNIKLQRSFTCYLWILRESPRIFFGAIVVVRLIGVKLCTWLYLLFLGPPSLESIFFYISQIIASSHYVRYISIDLLGIWHILLCAFFETTCC